MKRKRRNLTRKEYWAKYRHEIKTMKFDVAKPIEKNAPAQASEVKVTKTLPLASRKRGSAELIQEYEQTHKNKEQSSSDYDFKIGKIIGITLLLVFISLIVFLMIRRA